jgi:PAS domain S-box-containing protein
VRKENLWRAIDAIDQGFQVIAFDWRYLYVNAAAARQQGRRSREEFVGRTMTECHPGIEETAMFRALARCMQDRQPTALETEFVYPDGKAAWFDLRIQPCPEGVSVLSLAITGRNRAEERFHAAVESAPNGMIMVDRTGRIVLVNREAERLFGYTREELLRRSIEHLVPSRFRGQHPSHRAGFFADPKTRAMGAGRDLHAVRKDGTEIPVEIGLNPIETEDGVFVLASVVDITARKRAETELRRSNEELERFAYVASHDLQEPLRMVGSFVQLLATRYRGRLDADADEFIGFALDGALRMQQMIEDLLTFSRVGTSGAELVPTDAGAALTRSLAGLKLAIDEAAAAVSHDPLPTVLADGRQLEHLFQNLVSNAIKFRGCDPPRVHVTAELHDRAWTLSVRDNGIGIDPEYFDRIFVAFQRLHGREKYPGTGIGLALAKKIVERHGGRIWVESAPGRGATFRFTLPAVPEQAL